MCENEVMFSTIGQDTPSSINPGVNSDSNGDTTPENSLSENLAETSSSEIALEISSLEENITSSCSISKI